MLVAWHANAQNFTRLGLGLLVVILISWLKSMAMLQVITIFSTKHVKNKILEMRTRMWTEASEL